MKVLVLGASGRLGQETSLALRIKGHQVVPTSSKPRPQFVALNLRNIISDLKIDDLSKDVDAVIYLAADTNDYSLGSIEFDWQLNINAVNVKKFANYCLEKTKKFLYISGAIVYKNHINFTNKESSPFAEKSFGTYQASKIKAENLLGDLPLSNIHLKIVRPPSIYGGLLIRPGLIENKCKQAMKTGSLDLYQPINSQFNFIHASDLAEFMTLFLDTNFCGPINVSNLESYSVREIVETISQLTGAEIQLKNKTDDANSESKYSLDLSRMQSLNWRPRVDLKEGIYQILNQLKN